MDVVSDVTFRISWGSGYRGGYNTKYFNTPTVDYLLGYTKRYGTRGAGDVITGIYPGERA